MGCDQRETIVGLRGTINLGNFSFRGSGSHLAEEQTNLCVLYRFADSKTIFTCTKYQFALRDCSQLTQGQRKFEGKGKTAMEWKFYMLCSVVSAQVENVLQITITSVKRYVPPSHAHFLQFYPEFSRFLCQLGNLFETRAIQLRPV